MITTDPLYFRSRSAINLITNNIPTEAMKYFDNDRKKVQRVMKGTINLILQGVKVELAYEKVKGTVGTYAAKENIWKDRVTRLVEKAKNYDEEVKDKYRGQMETDVDKKLKEWRDEGHQGFANGLYNFLEKKYDWRTWFVISYNEIAGFDNHCGHECDGMHRYRKYGRNLRVASFDADYQDPFNRTAAGHDLKALKYESHAEKMYDNLPTRWKYCSSGAAVGVITEGARDAKFKAPWYRMNYYQPGYYKPLVYIFG